MGHLIFVKLPCIPNYSFLGYVEATFPGGWPGSDNKTFSVQLDLIGTSTGTELDKNEKWSSDTCNKAYPESF